MSAQVLAQQELISWKIEISFAHDRFAVWFGLMQRTLLRAERLRDQGVLGTEEKTLAHANARRGGLQIRPWVLMLVSATDYPTLRSCEAHRTSVNVPAPLSVC